jgi:hypothetical protein
MKLVLGTLVLAVCAGYLMGGRLSALSNLRIRWAPLALVGLTLQMVNLSGRLPGTDLEWPIVFLLTSFVLLTVFAIANLGTRGFGLILIGTLMNFTVIAANGGMPVSAYALDRSGQGDTISDLTDNADLYVKHHLADGEDHVVFLGDVIPLVPPISQAISLGDIFTYGGVAVVVALGMRRRPEAAEAEGSEEPVRAPVKPVSGQASGGKAQGVNA